MAKTFRGRCDCGYISKPVVSERIGFLALNRSTSATDATSEVIDISCGYNEQKQTLARYGHSPLSAIIAGQILIIAGGFCTRCGNPVEYYQVSVDNGGCLLFLPASIGGLIGACVAGLQYKSFFAFLFFFIVATLFSEFLIRIIMSKLLGWKHRKRMRSLHSSGCKECGVLACVSAERASQRHNLPCPSCSKMSLKVNQE